MKIYVSIILTALAIEGWCDEVKIHSIKVTGNTYASERVIREYFTDFGPVNLVDRAELDAFMRRPEERLMNTMYFYIVSIVEVEQRDDPKSVNIMLEVAKWFLYQPGRGHGASDFLPGSPLRACKVEMGMG